MSDFWPWMPLLALANAYLGWRRLLAYLRYYQQEGYEAIRFLRWTNVRSLTDPAFWLSIVAAFLFRLTPGLVPLLFIIVAVFLGWAQPDPRRSGKIPLKLTWRAKRALAVACVVAGAVWVLATDVFSGAGLEAAFIGSAILYAAMPLSL